MAFERLVNLKIREYADKGDSKQVTRWGRLLEDLLKHKSDGLEDPANLPGINLCDKRDIVPLRPGTRSAEIFKIIEEAGGEPVHKDTIADNIGVSTHTVSVLVNRIQKRGYPVETVRGKGFRFTDKP